MHFLANGALISKIGLLGHLLSGHLELGDRGLAVSAPVPSAPCLASSPRSNLAPISHAARVSFLVLSDLVLRMLSTVRTKSIRILGQFHVAKTTSNQVV